MKLRYRLEVWEKTVLFQVLEMDERFRSPVEGIYSEHKTPVNLTVLSKYSPEISPLVICLQGFYKCSDSDVKLMKFKTEDEARTYVTKVHEALRDWAKNWEGWKESKAEVVKPVGNVFEV